LSSHHAFTLRSYGGRTLRTALLAFRVPSSRAEPKTFKADVVQVLGLDAYFGQASNWLDAFTPFSQYLRGIELEE
jgi:hypothetical protein